MMEVFLLLGSNLGDRQRFLKQAVGYIQEQIAAVDTLSSIYETQSWGKTDEPDYLNQVVKLKTDIRPELLLKKILGIEQQMGRERMERWGSRIIDIDILFYDSIIVNEPQLQIPHPQLHKRKFTLEPLAEIAPAFIHPVLKKSILELKKELIDGLTVKRI